MSENKRKLWEYWGQMRNKIEEQKIREKSEIKICISEINEKQLRKMREKSEINGDIIVNEWIRWKTGYKWTIS